MKAIVESSSKTPGEQVEVATQTHLASKKK
jgi:hypothetical protein